MEEVDDFTLEGEIFFWIHQFAEHVQFEIEGLRVVKFGNDALIRDGNQLLRALKLIYDHKITKQDLIETMLKRLRAYEEGLLNTGRERYIGFVYPSMLDHHLLELEHLENVLREELDPRRLLSFYAHMHEDHAEIVSRLLDPQEDAFKEEMSLAQADMERLEGMALSRKEDFQNSLDFAREKFAVMDESLGDIMTGVEDRSLDSVISPDLSRHLQLEGMRASAALDRLET